MKSLLLLITVFALSLQTMAAPIAAEEETQLQPICTSISNPISSFEKALPNVCVDTGEQETGGGILCHPNDFGPPTHAIPQLPTQ
jgi:hypothetical protein